VFLEPPAEYKQYGIENGGEDLGDVAWKLNCTTYGLNVATVDFDAHYSQINIEKLNMRRFVSEPSVYVGEDMMTVVARRVDTGMVIGGEGLKSETKQEGEELLSDEDARKFRTGTGKLLFVAAERCDLQFATKEISRGMSQPTVGDALLLKRAARYLSGTRGYISLIVPEDRNNIILQVEVDSDWAGDKMGRNSTSRGHIYFNET
ncbi:unnamed protein product, partial [Prorocentrum cordatum]